MITLPPFKAFLASNIPSVYDNTLSYYDELTKLIAYLEQQVVPAVNANTEGLKVLKDYVENYFKNLDVQEEIDNKLDEMAESGQLAEIIAAYLELKGVLAFDTPVALKAATNLIEGSYAKTYGYKRKDDGVYDLYTIRATSGDVDDGYNTIILTSDPTLVAIRLQQGTKRVIQLKSDDNIQDYLSLVGEKEIILPANASITATDALLLNSDTTIDLNGSTLNFSFDRSSIFDYDWDETLGFMAYGPQAARALGYDVSMVCESGIPAVVPEHPMFPIHGMEDIYAYTDELYDQRRGVTPEKWDFEKNHNDVVVINLGTNDSNPIRFYRHFEEIEAMEKWFAKKYKEFVLQVRALNGPDTYIVCALGSMDYYLYHHIRDIVEEIKKETGDQKICSFEFIPINVMFEGYGAMGHPSQKTHDRMARELVFCINKYVKGVA